MRTKFYFLAALAATMLASCADEQFVGDNSPNVVQNESAIGFGFNLPAVTRADQTGKTAATTLGNTFYVYGIKTESTDGAGNVQAGHTVFKNYVVKYEDNTAYTTTSNTKNWEYVGLSLTDNEAEKINANEKATQPVQTIKYWDYTAPDYTFYAFSAASTDIEGGKISIVKNQDVSSGTKPEYRNGYTASLSAGLDLDKLFFSERVNIPKTTDKDRAAVNQYGGNVTLRFHNAASKVRVAMYETVDGYSVTLNKFNVVEKTNPNFNEMVNDVTANFAANLCNSKEGDVGTLTVTYYDDSELSTKNHPILSFAPTAHNVLNLGTNLKASTVLAENITSPTYDQDGGTYTSMFPQKDNTQNLKLKLSYTLKAKGTEETITVTDATAEIPADYLKWKPGFSYTYIFKISQNTNGSTGTPGTDPAGLYPITFDAVATLTEDGLAEYITTVSEPSITTFGVKGSKYVTGKADYETGTDIYATIMDGTVQTPTLASNVNVYWVTTDDATNFPINEASVAESIAEISAGTKKVHCTNINTNPSSTYFTAVPEAVTTVPGEDGVNITINALKLTGVKTAGKYAIEYIKTPATYHCTEHTYASAGAVTEALAIVQLYKDATGNTPATAGDYVDENTKFYTRDAVDNVGEYTYKIITVQ